MDTTTATPRSLPVRPADLEEPCCEIAGPLPALDTAYAARLADRLKALADPTRLRMLDLLTRQGVPLCVCEITGQFSQHQPTISHHLRILREAGLIRGEKRGTWAYYAATEEGQRAMSTAKTLLS